MALTTRRYKESKIFLLLKMGIMILIPIVLIILPKDFFDHGQSISLFELFGVKDYYSKHMTKSIMHLIHFDFETAWNYNKIAFIAYPIIAFLWLRGFLKTAKQYEVLHQSFGLKFSDFLYRLFRV